MCKTSELIQLSQQYSPCIASPDASNYNCLRLMGCLSISCSLIFCFVVWSLSITWLIVGLCNYGSGEVSFRTCDSNQTRQSNESSTIEKYDSHLPVTVCSVPLLCWWGFSSTTKWLVQVDEVVWVEAISCEETIWYSLETTMLLAEMEQTSPLRTYEKMARRWNFSRNSRTLKLLLLNRSWTS